MEEEESFVDHNLPKSLNSDISYFGVGGKQAIFFIGNATRVSKWRVSDISYFGVGGKQAIFFIGNATRVSKWRVSDISYFGVGGKQAIFFIGLLNVEC